MGQVTKDEFENTLRCRQAYRDETKSEQRDRAKVPLLLAAQRQRGKEVKFK